MAEIKLRASYFRNNFNLRGCDGVAATGGTKRAHHHFTNVKEMLLLPDSNYTTWAPSIPCCLLSRPPVFCVRKPKNHVIFPRRVLFR